VIEDVDEPPEQDAPNVAAIAVMGFMVGLILWLGGACLVLGDGGGDSDRTLSPGSVTTPQARITPTRLADRTNCAEIRNTDYRSQTERQWFLANCT